MLDFHVPGNPEVVVEFGEPSVLAAIDEVFAGKQGTLNKLAAIHTRPRTYGEAFGGQTSLRDVRAAVKQITKAFINQ